MRRRVGLLALSFLFVSFLSTWEKSSPVLRVSFLFTHFVHFEFTFAPPGGNGFKSRKSKRGDRSRDSVIDSKDRKKEKLIEPDGFSMKSLDELFCTYADESKLVIGVDGIIQFCNDIGVSLEDPVMLVISWLMNASEQGQYTKDEFVGGFFKERYSFFFF